MTSIEIQFLKYVNRESDFASIEMVRIEH